MAPRKPSCQRQQDNGIRYEASCGCLECDGACDQRDGLAERMRGLPRCGQTHAFLYVQRDEGVLEHAVERRGGCGGEERETPLIAPSSQSCGDGRQEYHD